MGTLKLYPTNIRMKGAVSNMHIIAEDKKEAIAICKEINSDLKITGDSECEYSAGATPDYHANQVEQVKKWLADPRNKWEWNINE